VFVEDGLGGARFETLPVLDDEEVAQILATVQRRVLQLLQRRGLVDACDTSQAPDAMADAEPALAGITAASVVGTSAVGPRAGARLRRWGDSDAVIAPPPAGPRHARLDGFDLHANLVVPPRDRQRLERVCRYALRPPIAQDRLHLTRDGQVVLELRHRWTDGTTHLVFDPLELLERLAALTPRPRINLVLYYGVFAPHAKRRAWVIAAARGDLGMVTSVGRTRSGDGARGGCNGPAHRPPGQPCGPPGVRQPAADAVAPAAAPPGQTSSDWGGSSWAQLMRRSFGFDVLACSRCGGRLRLVATIDQRAVVDRILRHLGLPTDLPVPRPARAPPLGEAVRDVPFGGGTDVADVEPC